MRDHGLDYNGPIHDDSKLHRFKCSDDRDENSWYKLHAPNPVSAGAFGCWKRSISERWCHQNGSPLDPETASRLREQWRKDALEREEAETRIFDQTAKRINEMLPDLDFAHSDHPYTTAKKIPARGALIRGDDLLIPLKDINGKVWSYQTIAPDGSKRFCPSARVKGSHIKLGDNITGPLLICEGWATGVSLIQSTSFQTVCAMNCGNLLEVAQAYRHHFPSRKIVICGDNDRKTEGNPGASKAAQAAEKIGAKLAVVAIPDAIPGSDFNDVFCHPDGGAKEVKLQIETALSKPTLKPKTTQETRTPHSHPSGNHSSEYLPECDENGNQVDESSLPPIIDAATFCFSELVEPDQLVEGLIHKGTKVMIGGGSKSFKTWVQLDLGLCVCYGITWMGRNIIPGRVLFINFEIKEAFFQRRIRKICESRGITQTQGKFDVWNLRGHAASYNILIPQIIQAIRNKKYALVIIDPVYKIYSVDTDENSANKIAQMLNSLEGVCVETESAIIFGAHYSKGNQASKEAIDRVSGSGVFARDPDSILPFTAHEDPDSFVIEPILRNLPPIPPFVVTWNYPLMELNPSLDPSKLKSPGGRPKENTESDLLDILKDGPLDLKKWYEKAVSKLSISRATFYRLKSNLLSQNLVFYSKLNDHWQVIEKQ